MKIKLKNISQDLRPNQVGIAKLFIKFLHTEIPIKKNLVINFTNKRNNSITTGNENDGVISVFTKSRILIDILRTLAHEWVHFTENDSPNERPIAPAKSEDLANSLSGYLIRRFVENNPQIEVEIYKD